MHANRKDNKEMGKNYGCFRYYCRWFLISFLFVNIFFVKLKSIDQTVIDLWCMTNKINGRLNDLLRRRLCVAYSLIRFSLLFFAHRILLPHCVFFSLTLFASMFVSNQFICKQISSWANRLNKCELQTGCCHFIQSNGLGLNLLVVLILRLLSSLSFHRLRTILLHFNSIADILYVL